MRRKRRQTEEAYINKLKSYQNKEIPLAPIIEKITGKAQSTRLSNIPIPNFHNQQIQTPIKSPNVSPLKNPINMSNDSEFFNEMLNEFNKYSPFENISDIDHKENNSEAGVSFFERDVSDI